MRALTWNNPYGALMLHGKVETRMYKTNVRGEVLICAAKRRCTLAEILAISGKVQYQRMYDVLGMVQYKESKNYLALKDHVANSAGVAIAVGELVDCQPMLPKDENDTYVQYDPNRWCWIFENVRPIKPFAWKGKQGWSFVPDEIVKNITYRI